MDCLLILICGSFFILLITLILVLTNCKKEHFTTKDPMLIYLHAMLSKIHPIANDVTLNSSDKSYTLNKKHINLCLKDPDGEYYNNNMLIYVATHELAHVLCPDIGHTDNFWKLNNELLEKASKLGIYNPSIPPVKSYIDTCGTH